MRIVVALLFIAMLVAILAMVEALRAVHESIGIAPKVFGHARMMLEILVHLRMLLSEVPIVDQFRIVPHLLGYFGMLVEIIVELPHVGVMLSVFGPDGR